jgi:hypothetical protein
MPAQEGKAGEHIVPVSTERLLRRGWTRKANFAQGMKYGQVNLASASAPLQQSPGLELTQVVVEASECGRAVDGHHLGRELVARDALAQVAKRLVKALWKGSKDQTSPAPDHGEFALAVLSERGLRTEGDCQALAGGNLVSLAEGARSRGGRRRRCRHHPCTLRSVGLDHDRSFRTQMKIEIGFSPSSGVGRACQPRSTGTS